MRKLRTPLQYESALDELNKIRPLQVSDIVKPSICMPVCNRYADSDSKASDGVFVKGTHQGHILIKNSPIPTQYELQQYNVLISTEYANIEFAQPVKRVVVNMLDISLVTEVYWCVPNNPIMLQDLEVLGTHLLNFIGTKFSIRFTGLPPMPIIFDVYGFY